jgi:hypothetical protein
MTLPSRLSGFALAILLLAGGLLSATSAKAEDLVDFLWGGGEEYGGGRSVVSFDPKYKPSQIIVSFSDRRLYFITKPGEAITYPVAVPKGDARWQGVTFVSNKRVNPPWTPTPDMLRENPRLPHWVPGGHPMNPLGIRAMYLGSSAYRIHGTDAPWTIGHAVSHGCIRMTNEDVLDLYPRIPVGTRVTVTWQHFTTGSAVSGASYPRYGADEKKAEVGYSQSPSSSRTASRAPTDGSLSSLFFWDDDAPKQSAAPAPVKRTRSDSKTAEAPTKKKKSASSTPVRKKKPAVAEKKSASISGPSHAIPDPVKPDEAALADPMMPAATKTSASAEGELAAQNSSEQVQ